MRGKDLPLAKAQYRAADRQVHCMSTKELHIISEEKNNDTYIIKENYNIIIVNK